MINLKDCERAYKMEKRGDVFLDKDEIRWLAQHIRQVHPEEWKESRLNPDNARS